MADDDQEGGRTDGPPGGINPAAIAETAPALLALVDRRGAAAWVNGQWSALTGRAVESLLGKGWLASVHHEFRPRLLEHVRRGETFEVDVWMLRADHRFRWLAVRGTPHDAATMVVSAIDITAEREAQRALRLLAAVGDELNASFAVDEVLDRVAHRLVGEVADLCTISVRDGRGRVERVALVHVEKEAEAGLQHLLRSPVDATEPSAISEVVRTGALLYRPIVDAPGPDEPWPPVDCLATEGANRSLICVPLRTRDDVVGVLAVVSWTHRYTPDDVALVQEIAQRCAIAVDNATLFRNSEEARARLSLVSAVGEQLAGTFDIQEMVDALARRVVPVFADVAVVALLEDDETLVRRAICHVDPEREEAARDVLLGVPFAVTASDPPARAVRTRRPVLIEEFDRRTQGTGRRRGRGDDVGRMLEASSVLSVPLLARGEPLGALTIAFTSSERRYSASDLPLAFDLARRASLALERARAFAQERRIAETLQRSMLPDVLPDVPGMSFCARYLPGGVVDVGGDWYDVIPLPAGRYGVAIGDVAGHGLRAATVMGQLRHALRAFAADGHDPATVVSRLNRFVFEQGPFDLATLCYGVLDPERGRLELTIAGHVPPMLFAPGRPASFLLPRPSPPVGADVMSRYSSVLVDLEPGATMLFFTDGLIERRRETLDAGFERLLQAARFAPPLLDALCDQVLERLVGDSHPEDDIALLGLRYVGAARGSFRIRRPARAAELGPVRRILAAWLESSGVAADEIGSITVAVTEAATNAIEHAYGPVAGWFEIEAAMSDDAVVTLTVRDGGRWRPKASVGGGRGLVLIGRLMDEFELRRLPSGTEIWMQRRVRGKTTEV